MRSLVEFGLKQFFRRVPQQEGSQLKTKCSSVPFIFISFRFISIISTFIFLAFSNLGFAQSDSANELALIQKSTRPEVKVCSYVENNQYCQIGKESPKCEPRPKSYKLIRIKTYKAHGRICFEKETIDVNSRGQSQKTDSTCGPDTREFHQKSSQFRCKLWDECANCESGMRIEN